MRNKIFSLITLLSLTGCVHQDYIERTVEIAREGIPVSNYGIKIRPKVYDSGELFRDPLNGMDNIGVKSSISIPVDREIINGSMKFEGHSDLQSDNWGVLFNLDVKY